MQYHGCCGQDVVCCIPFFEISAGRDAWAVDGAHLSSQGCRSQDHGIVFSDESYYQMERMEHGYSEFLISNNSVSFSKTNNNEC